MKTFIVFDLEATCWERGQEEAQSEIIEIGAVAHRPGEGAGSPLAEFQTFVHPGLAPRLSDFCTQLTSIRQSDVDSAPSFPEAIVAFRRWAEPFSPYALASWGDYDRRQVAADCRLHKMANPFESVPHVNLKALFAAAHCLKKKDGLGQALRRLGIAREGTAHRGIDDARNIVRILQAGLEVHLKVVAGE